MVGAARFPGASPGLNPSLGSSRPAAPTPPPSIPCTAWGVRPRQLSQQAGKDSRRSACSARCSAAGQSAGAGPGSGPPPGRAGLVGAVAAPPSPAPAGTGAPGPTLVRDGTGSAPWVRRDSAGGLTQENGAGTEGGAGQRNAQASSSSSSSSSSSFPGSWASQAPAAPGLSSTAQPDTADSSREQGQSQVAGTWAPGPASVNGGAAAGQRTGVLGGAGGSSSPSAAPPPIAGEGGPVLSGAGAAARSRHRGANARGETDLDPRRALPLPMVTPGSSPISAEEVQALLNCDPDVQSCKEPVYQWTSRCTRCQGSGFASSASSSSWGKRSRRKKSAYTAWARNSYCKCIACCGVGYVQRYTVRGDIPVMEDVDREGQ